MTIGNIYASNYLVNKGFVFKIVTANYTEFFRNFTEMFETAKIYTNGMVVYETTTVEIEANGTKNEIKTEKTIKNYDEGEIIILDLH